MPKLSRCSVNFLPTSSGSSAETTRNAWRSAAGLRHLSIEDQNRYAEAEQAYKRLLEDDQRVLGADHPGTLNTRLSLARIAAAQGRLREARRLYRQLLSDRQRLLGEDHPVTQATREFLTRTTETAHLAGHPGMAPSKRCFSQPGQPMPPSPTSPKKTAKVQVRASRISSPKVPGRECFLSILHFGCSPLRQLPPTRRSAGTRMS